MANNLYEAMRQDGLTDDQIKYILKQKYGELWQKAAQKIGMPIQENNVIDVNNLDVKSNYDIPKNTIKNEDTSSTMNPDEFSKSQTIQNSNDIVLDVKEEKDDKGNSIINPATGAKQYKPITLEKSFDAFQTGDAQTFAGAIKFGLKLLNAIGIDTPEANKYIDKAIQEFKRESSQQEKEGYGTFNKMGAIAPTLATLPISYNSPATAALTEGAIGAAYSYGQGGDDVDAAITGLTSGGITGTGVYFIGKLIDKLPKRQVKKTLEYLKNYFNVDDKTVEEAYKAYTKIMKPSQNEYADKVKALIQYLGPEGASITKDAIKAGGHKTAKGVLKEMTDRAETLKNVTNVDIHPVVSALEQAKQDVMNKYSNWIERANKYEGNKIKLSIPTASDEASLTLNKAIKELIDNPTTQNLIDAYQLASKAARKSRDAQKAFKYNKLKQAIDKELKSRLPEDMYNEFKDINKEYATVMNVYNKPFGKLISEVQKGNRSVDELIDTIAKSKASNDKTLYESIQKIIGPEKAADFEKAIINKYLKGERNSFIWNNVHKGIKDKLFVTPEGKHLQQTIDTLAKYFNTDDALKVVKSAEGVKTNTGWSDDLIAKAKFRLIENIWEYLLKKLPTENAKYARKMDTVAKILSKPNNINKSEIMQKALIKTISEDFDTFTKDSKTRKGLYKIIDKIFKPKKAKELKKAIYTKDKYNFMKKGSIVIGKKRNVDDLLYLPISKEDKEAIQMLKNYVAGQNEGEFSFFDWNRQARLHNKEYPKPLKYFFNHEGNFEGQVQRAAQAPIAKLKNLKPGDVIRNNQILSTTTDDSTVDMFKEMNAQGLEDGNAIVHFYIDIPKNAKQYDISKISEELGMFEDEILIKPKSYLKVKKVEFNPEGYFGQPEYQLYLEVVPKTDKKPITNLLSTIPSLSIPVHKNQEKGDNNE